MVQQIDYKESHMSTVADIFLSEIAAIKPLATLFVVTTDVLLLK